MSKKLKIRFTKFENALAMQILEQEGSFRDSEHVCTGFPELCCDRIYLCDKEERGNLGVFVRSFEANAERDEYLKNVIRWISEEQFAECSEELKVGEWCAARMTYGWRKRKLVAILPERYKNRFIVDVANNDRNWMFCDEVRPFPNCIEPAIDGDVYAWKKQEGGAMDESIDLKEVLRLHERWLKGYGDGRRADLSQEDLRGANLRNADLSCASLNCANLNGAYLRGAYLRGAYLRGASLRDADLGGATLRGADLRGADLRDADLNGANLRGANLRDADLNGANLRGANLRDADLNGANLRDADLSYATFDDRIFCLGLIGSIKRRTTYNATKDIVRCGCFKGTFEEWVAKIRETYPDENNVYRKEYEAAIAFFKTVAEANEENAQNG